MTVHVPCFAFLRYALVLKRCTAKCRVRLATLLVLTGVVPACTTDLARLPGSSFAVARQESVSSPRHNPSADAVEKPDLMQEADALLHAHTYAASPAGMTAADTSLRAGLDARHDEPVFSINALDAPLKRVVFALAGDAGLQLSWQGDQDPLVTLRASAQTLASLLDQLAQQAGFVWHIRDAVLTIRAGRAYSHSYAIDYLNMHRRTESSVGLATRVGTINASTAQGNAVANSSQTRVENISEHHFWESLQSDLDNLVMVSESEIGGESLPFSINREAGILTLFASPLVHRRVQNYLNVLHVNVQRQVLIEATVVEVALSDSFDAGIDWQLLANGISGLSAAQILTGAPAVSADTVNRLGGPAGLVSLVQQNSAGDIRATLSLLEQFGDVRILSRPRIIALNNQSSLLKVVDNRVYFTVNVQRRQSDETDEVVTETQIHTVPVGLVMNVTPQISQDGTVMLNVRPTLSRILGFVNDPNPELALADVRNGVPEIQVREMESMLHVRSGHVAIIGGLMQETRSQDSAGVPGLGWLPALGKLFSKRSSERRQTELLIVLRPTVLPGSGTVALR